MLIIADDMQQRGVSIGSEGLDPPVPATDPAPAKPSARAKFSARQTGRAEKAEKAPSNADLLQAERAKLLHIPSEMQKAADEEDIKVIKKMFGSRAQTIINTLLAFDAYFAWYFPFKKSIPLFCDMEQRRARAFDNMCSAIDMHEAYERLSIRGHKSFYPHGAIYKTTRDILTVGDVWAFSTSALELLNAETKRTAASAGSKRLTVGADTFKSNTLTVQAGPVDLRPRKGDSSTMYSSVLNHLLITQVLRKGSGLYATPDARRKERLFGVSGPGRTSLPRSGVKLRSSTQSRSKSVEERLRAETGYEPASDTCVKALIRLLVARAEDALGSSAVLHIILGHVGYQGLCWGQPGAWGVVGVM